MFVAQTQPQFYPSSFTGQACLGATDINYCTYQITITNVATQDKKLRFGGLLMIILLVPKTAESTTVANILFSYLLVFRKHKVTQTEEGAVCSQTASQLQIWFNLSSTIVLLAYEAVLFVMSLVSLAKHFREAHRVNKESMLIDSITDVVLKDNVLYFFVSAFLALTSVSIPAIFHLSSYAFNVVYSGVIVIIFYSLYFSTLGPFMILSIREYDARKIVGSESSNGEGLAESLELATIRSQPEHATDYANQPIRDLAL
ncbi:hypothetical protein CONPUDRAFT_75297 [Coniophora puteana RWD-64-598 SS2]|uniref:Uncharacterized protein n=1 Tax=Coniophora puteana (strain RWD-64-598) TaxID=741705 RepID=A0A5M3MID5_CONPW|nr:uncharacterized protein CONPUDRAFT_75297 [Coniophora puteana RWD-64-598 SS2]EIW78680.1 hypothetical protein CONPUDRAFT_75297 [Coniophora puteana RWD-64-598 SS2]